MSHSCFCYIINALLYIAMSHAFSGVKVHKVTINSNDVAPHTSSLYIEYGQTFTINSDDSCTRDRNVINLCTFPLLEQYLHIMCWTFNPMLCTTLFLIKARAQFKSAFVSFNLKFYNNIKSTYQQHHGALSLCNYINILHTSPHSLHSFPCLRDRQILVSWGRITYQVPCTLPVRDLPPSISERKKSQTGASIPPTPGGQENHAHS